VCNSVLYRDRITWHSAGYQLPFLDVFQHKAEFNLLRLAQITGVIQKWRTRMHKHICTLLLLVLYPDTRLLITENLYVLFGLAIEVLRRRVNHNLHITKGKAMETLGHRSHTGVVGYESEQSSTTYFLSLQVKRTIQIFLNLLRIIQFQFSSSKDSNSTSFIKPMPTVVKNFLYVRYHYCLLPLEQAICSCYFSSWINCGLPPFRF
jgi:hypothetical protein